MVGSSMAIITETVIHIPIIASYGKPKKLKYLQQCSVQGIIVVPLEYPF